MSLTAIACSEHGLRGRLARALHRRRLASSLRQFHGDELLLLSDDGLQLLLGLGRVAARLLICLHLLEQLLLLLQEELELLALLLLLGHIEGSRLQQEGLQLV